MPHIGKTYAVLTFDIDGETLWTSRDKVNRIGPVMRSQGRYGPEVGLPRILGLLKRFHIPATFFVTGQVADRYPDQCRWILDQGHEIGHHNYNHEWPCKVGPEVERRDFEKGLEAIRRLTGTTPAGYRAPGWEFSEVTFKMLIEHGLQYSSNMMDDEKPYEYTVDGKSTGIVELPCSWILDDAAFFMYGLTYNPPMQPPSQVLEQWKAEYDGMYAERDGRVYVLTLHPQIIGRPSRMAMLKGLIDYISSKPETVFIGCEALVASLKKTQNLIRKAYVGAETQVV
jgi:peptidoglycan/xylan/chitin deacetylase (PgdA/CDA1 family)